jgi:hypothetical protein
MRRNIRDVHPGIALPGKIHLPPLQLKSVDEIPPEIQKLPRDIVFVAHRRRARRKPCPRRLVHPHHVRQVRPCVRVGVWLGRPGLPQERAVLAQEPRERAAAGAAVQPDGDLRFSLGMSKETGAGYTHLFSRIRVARREEPEEKTRASGRRVRQVPRVGLAAVEVDFWDCIPVDDEPCLISRGPVYLGITHTYPSFSHSDTETGPRRSRLSDVAYREKKPTQ